MILRVSWVLLMNGWLIELGGKWPGPDGKPAKIEGPNPETGQKQMYEIPAKVGAIFFVEDRSEGYPDDNDPERQMGRGEKAFYEIWAEPLNEQASLVIGGKIWSKGACTRRLRISESQVQIAEEEWPLEAAYKLGYQRAEEIKEDYEDIATFKMPVEVEKPKVQEAAAPAG